MIVICYDGSRDAKAAVEFAATLLKGSPATVLTVWQPFIEVLAHTPSGYGLAAGMVDLEEVDDASRRSAEEQAREGCELACRLGLNAQPRSIAQHTTVWAAILEQAQALRASAVVIGSRGLTGLRSALLGSVSHAVLQHADVPVIVVPSPDVAAARAHARAAHRPLRA